MVGGGRSLGFTGTRGGYGLGVVGGGVAGGGVGAGVVVITVALSWDNNQGTVTHTNGC